MPSYLIYEIACGELIKSGADIAIQQRMWYLNSLCYSCSTKSSPAFPNARADYRAASPLPPGFMLHFWFLTLQLLFINNGFHFFCIAGGSSFHQHFHILLILLYCTKHFSLWWKLSWTVTVTVLSPKSSSNCGATNSTEQKKIISTKLSLLKEALPKKENL